MTAVKFLTGHVINNPACTYKFQLKTTIDTIELLFKEINDYKPFMMICGSHHLVQLSQTSGPKGHLLSEHLFSQQKIFILKLTMYSQANVKKSRKLFQGFFAFLRISEL